MANGIEPLQLRTQTQRFGFLISQSTPTAGKGYAGSP